MWPGAREQRWAWPVCTCCGPRRVVWVCQSHVWRRRKGRVQWRETSADIFLPDLRQSRPRLMRCWDTAVTSCCAVGVAAYRHSDVPSNGQTQLPVCCSIICLLTSLVITTATKRVFFLFLFYSECRVMMCDFSVYFNAEMIVWCHRFMWLLRHLLLFFCHPSLCVLESVSPWLCRTVSDGA